MDDSQRQVLVDWLLPQLEQAWDEGVMASAMVLGKRYVQWAGHGFGIQIECSSNRFLVGADRLLPQQVARLRHLGWHDPVGDDLPNYWQVFLNREELVDAARALVHAVEVLRPRLAVVPAAPGPQPVAATPGRVVAVVPLEQAVTAEVAVARAGAVAALGACVVVDFFTDGDSSDLPRRPFEDILTRPEPLLEPVQADMGFSFRANPARSRMMLELGRAFDRVRRLRRRGLDCVLVLPAMHLEHRWLYGAALGGADVVVFVLQGQQDAHQAQACLVDTVLPLGEVAALLASAPTVEGPVLGALRAFTAVVEAPEPELRRDALEILVRQARDRTDAAPWPPQQLREILLHAQLVPLAARLAALSRPVRTDDEASAAVRLLGDLLTAVQDHLEHVQDVGFGALGELSALFGLLAEAARRGIAGVGLAAAPLRWLADCGGDDVDVVRAASAAVDALLVSADSPRRPAPQLLPALLDDLDAEASVRSLVDTLAAGQPVVAARQSDYVSLRPAAGGSVAVYVHRATLAIALPPGQAAAAADAVPAAVLQQKTGITSYLRVPAASLLSHHDAVLELCSRSLAWRASAVSGAQSSLVSIGPVAPTEAPCRSCGRRHPSGSCSAGPGAATGGPRRGR